MLTAGQKPAAGEEMGERETAWTGAIDLGVVIGANQLRCAARR